MQPNYPGIFILIRDKTLDNTARKPMTFSSVATSQSDFLKGRPLHTSVGGMIFSTKYSRIRGTGKSCTICTDLRYLKLKLERYNQKNATHPNPPEPTPGSNPNGKGHPGSRGGHTQV